MSKKGGKSTPSKGEKGDKTRTTPTNELVPGILDNEWVIFQEMEQRDEIVVNVLQEIIDNSLDVALHRHIDRLAVQKAVSDVTQILSDSLKLYFISHDTEMIGCGNLKEIESHDLPPSSSETDSWSRGRVQVVKRVNTELQSRCNSRVSAGINVAFNGSVITDPTEQPESGSSIILKPSARHEETANEVNPDNKTERKSSKAPLVKSIQDETNITRTKNFKRYTGRVRSGNLKNITTPLDKAEETMLKSHLVPDQKETGVPSSFGGIWKVMHNRPSNKDLVQFDENGNVASISKLTSKALPNIQKSRPGVHIEDHKKSAKKDKTIKAARPSYRVASLRPISASHLSQPQTFELASGVKLIQGEYDGSSVRSISNTSRTNQKLEPIRIIQNAPFDAKHIIKTPETSY